MSHEFDFWIGAWEVIDQATGELAGHNVIEAHAGGLVLVESYSTPRGFAGLSLNAWDAAAGRWHQCWMDSSGTVLDLYGGIVGEAMVMTGETPKGSGVQLERITWTPSPNGTVRQHWEQSPDGGATWTTVFDGLYRKQPDAERDPSGRG